MKPLQSGNRPEWCDVTSAGIFRVSTDGGRFDRHYHDFDEYWLVFAGSAKILTEECKFVVSRGDIVCTRAGDEHDVLEVYQDFEAWWFEGPCPEGGRTGHLHRDAEKAKGHAVPYLPGAPDRGWLAAGGIGDTDPMALPVNTIGPALAFYTRMLGFTVVSRDAGSARLRRGGAEIGIAENGADPQQASCWFSVRDLDAVRTELAAAGIEPGVVDIQEWDGRQHRVFFAKEPFGVCFCFSQAP